MLAPAPFRLYERIVKYLDTELLTMTVKFITGMMPLFILCCILAMLVTADLQGFSVSLMLFMLNGAGIVLALFHGLEFRP